MPPNHITVCICTYRRTLLLPRLFDAIARQKTENLFTISVAIVDNDGGSARGTVDDLARRLPFKIVFSVEPERNFAAVRNRVVGLAEGAFYAFIDDDEVPVDDWLLRLFRAINEYKADAALGPVRPYFERPPPSWIIKGRVCERPGYPTGTWLDWRQTRTGNVLLRSGLFTERQLAFDLAYAKGGEDVDFFKRAGQQGCRFVWCEEGAVYELVPNSRLQKSYYLRRALLQGAISSQYAHDARKPAAFVVGLKALVGFVGYSLFLPISLVFGQHVFLKFLIKACHHVGRLGALLGIHLVSERPS